ncbi:hypothetical protein B5X24_HaOG207451 [Helicoverpa armigera]|nr:hypothetical protein B5X24_HaOG207451 [Helicoverpa armigera]
MDEHNRRLREVLNKLQQMGLRLNVRKCVFAANSITFLGHMIDAEGLHPAPAKVKEIQEKSAPTNRETLRAFLGLYNFYEKFLPDKSTVLEPLYRLLESKRPWRWGEKEQEAFVEAKRLLSSERTLVGYDLQKELLLICDSSEYGLGAIIAHVMNDGIKYRPGKLIGNADALSWWTAPDTSSVQEEVLRDVLLLEEQPSGWELDASTGRPCPAYIPTRCRAAPSSNWRRRRSARRRGLLRCCSPC